MARRIRPKKPVARKTGKDPRGRPFPHFEIELRPRFFSGRGTPSKPYALTPYALERHRQRQLTEAEALYLARKTFSHQLRNLERPDVTPIKPVSFLIGPKGNTRTITLKPDYERLERVLLRYKRMKRKRLWG